MAKKVLKDYYKVLRVERTASAEEIKKSYHRLARIFHPDRNPDPGSVKHFNEINEAYKVLGNLESRLKYSMLLNRESTLIKQVEDYENGDK